MFQDLILVLKVVFVVIWSLIVQQVTMLVFIIESLLLNVEFAK